MHINAVGSYRWDGFVHKHSFGASSDVRAEQLGVRRLLCSRTVAIGADRGAQRTRDRGSLANHTQYDTTKKIFIALRDGTHCWDYKMLFRLTNFVAWLWRIGESLPQKGMPILSRLILEASTRGRICVGHVHPCASTYQL